MLIYNGQIIAGGGTIVLPMTRAEYEANKAILDSADVWVDLTDEPDQIAEADQVAFWVGQTQKSVGYIGDIATKALAKVEPTDTALYLHEVGTGFINKDGNYCITDIQISVGESIVLGTNCHVVDGGISSNLSHEYVEVSINNGDKWGVLLNRLYSAIDATKITPFSKIVVAGRSIYNCIDVAGSFSVATNTSGDAANIILRLRLNDSTRLDGIGTTRTDETNTNVDSAYIGSTIRLYYR